MKKVLAIVPARGGSKRIPGKNMRKFLGREIISYPLQALKEAKGISKVFVSTDCSQIQEFVKLHSAEAPVLRSDKNSDDFATTFDVVDEVLNYIDELYDYVVCVYPTSVFISSNMVDKAIEKIETESEATGVCTVLQYIHPIQRALEIEEGYVRSVMPHFYNYRTQDLPPRYHDAGQLYLFKPEVAISEKRLITSCTIPLVVNESEVHDIDTLDDWQTAEFKYRRIMKNV